MTRKALFRRAFPATALLLALAAFAPVTVAAAELLCRPSTDFCAEVSGAYAPDARFFAPDTEGRYLIDIPSLSVSVLLNLKTKMVFTVPQSKMEREAGDSIVRLDDPIPSELPSSALSIDGEVMRFRIDRSEVRVLKGHDCQSIVTPTSTAAPVTNDPSARGCLHQDARPLTATSVCTKGAYLKNSCDAPVVVVLQTTQHLTSGTLPQTSTIVLPPGADRSLGCVWSSGAMAPTVYEVLAATFLPGKTVSEHRDRAATNP